MPAVYRAPMLSRRDDVEPYLAVERALRDGLCGMGEVPEGRPVRRLDRFAAAPPGSFVWTRDEEELTYLGRLTGPCRRDESPLAVLADLVNVRDCTWLSEPVPPAKIPPAVTRSFGRGGRNFQQIRHPAVEALTVAVWETRLNAAGGPGSPRA